MKRWILFILSMAMLYYVALIYFSPSMLFIVYAILILESCLQLYNLFFYRKFSIRIHTPLAIVEKNERIPVELTLYNRSFLPAGQIRIQLQAVYPMRSKRQKYQICSGVPGRKWKQQKSSLRLRFELEPGYAGKVEVSVKQVFLMDLLGILPSKLCRKNVSDQSAVMVLPEKQEIPLEIDSMVRQFSLDRETELRIQGEKNPPEVALVREYQPGDALHNVHWKLTAKQDVLMVREHISEQSCPILFFIDLRGASERFFQVFYSLGLELLRQKCSYYLVYYEWETQDLVRVMIGCEEDLYDYFLQTDLTDRKRRFWLRRKEQDEKTILPDWEGEYREKYRQISYAAKLVLRKDLVCTYNDETVWEEMRGKDEAVVQ